MPLLASPDDSTLVCLRLYCAKIVDAANLASAACCFYPTYLGRDLFTPRFFMRLTIGKIVPSNSLFYMSCEELNFQSINGQKIDPTPQSIHY